MTSDGDALFCAIREQPWEDTPRLIYADWLQENGDPLRAEFIRLQVEIASGPNKARAGELRARAKRLHTEARGRWTRGSPTGTGVRIGREFSRGFYHEVTFESADVFTEYAEHVFAWTPIDKVTVWRLTGTALARVLQSHYLARVTDLSFWGEIGGDTGCRAVAQCPHLLNLVALDLSDSTITDAGALALADAPYLQRLRRLRLGRANRITQSVFISLMGRFDTISVQ